MATTKTQVPSIPAPPKNEREATAFYSSVKEALEIAKKNGDTEPFIIGGGQIYKLALEANLVDTIYLTKVHHAYDGDTFFSELGKDWKEIERIDCKADEKHAHDYSFLTFEKIN